MSSAEESSGHPPPGQSHRIWPQQIEKAPPCQVGCPIGTDIRGWIGRIGQHERLHITFEAACRQAWEQLAAFNPLPATLSRVCYHPCESNCNRAQTDGAVGVNDLERFIGDWAIDRELQLPGGEERHWPESIGVIGAGPAGLSFAYQMARRGYGVTIYERRSAPGGMLRFGIPDFRLPKAVLIAEIKRILALGVKLEVNVDVGGEVSLSTLRQQHKALFVGIGTQRPRSLNIPGEDGPGVWSGTSYLELRNTGQGLALGKRVVVVGGGNTAIDAARSARRDGAEVVLVYRRARADMPASDHEIEEAQRESVKIECLSAPREIRRDGQLVRYLVVQRTEPGESDGSGRRRPVPIPGSERQIRADAVIAAVSQESEWDALGYDPSGQLRSETTGAVRLEDRIWVGGDACGAGIAGLAVAHGLQAAEAVHAELQGLPQLGVLSRYPVRLGQVKPDFYEKRPPARGARRPATAGLAESDIGIGQTLTSEEFLEEAGRCFSCGLCFGCERCAMYCNPAAITRLVEVGPGGYFGLNLDICEGCAKCIEICPCGFLSPTEEQEPVQRDLSTV
jgi:NADPH-dependent glutamate synthase beta subunit-like oxidoreductase/ferredoxin